MCTTVRQTITMQFIVTPICSKIKKRPSKYVYTVCIYIYIYIYIHDTGVLCVVYSINYGDQREYYLCVCVCVCTCSAFDAASIIYIYIYIYYMTVDDNTYYPTAIKIIYILFRGITPSSM